jgi:hypothetical protein
MSDVSLIMVKSGFDSATSCFKCSLFLAESRNYSKKAIIQCTSNVDSFTLCKRQCFIMVTVYTIRGTNTPHVFPHDMFRPDGNIFRYIGVLQSSFSFLLLSSHWPVFTHWECLVCMVFSCPFCEIYCLWDI